MDPALEARIAAGMAAQHVPGCAIALVEDGRVREVQVYGVADAETGEPVTRRTRFSLQSVSKSMCAWAVMTLVEQGRLDLDAPISRVLKQWTLPPSDRFDLDLVTPRRLLSHHAGVTTAGFHGLGLHETGYTVVDAMEGRLPPPTPAWERHYAYWNLAPDDPLVTVTHQPGEAWRYSNAGFGLLELAVEDVTGRSYADYVTETVLRPLGMANAGFAREPGPLQARPHDREGRPAPDSLWPCKAAGGIYATIEDLAAFTCAAMRGPNGEPPGRGVLSPASVAEMHSSHGAGDQTNGVPFEAGLGHVLLRAGGPLNVHHSGGSLGWRSIWSAFPELGTGVCMLMNGEAANELWVPIVREWRDSLLGAGAAQ